MTLAVDPLPLDFGRDKEFCVYLYRDKRHRRPKVIYIGMGKTHTRPETHWRTGTHNALLAAVLGELRKAGLEPAVELVGFFDNKKEACAVEAALIRKFRGPGLCNAPDDWRNGPTKRPNAMYPSCPHCGKRRYMGEFVQFWHPPLGQEYGWCGTCRRKFARAWRRTFRPNDSDLRAATRKAPVDQVQLKVARAGLGWSVEELASRSKLSITTIRRAEANGEEKVTEGSLLVLARTFRTAGVVFIEEDGAGRGVRFPTTRGQ